MPIRKVVSSLGRLAEQSPLTGPINLLARKDSFDTDFNDLATMVAASEIIDSIEVGLLTDFTVIFNPRLSGKHCDATRCGLRRRTNSCSADFTKVPSGARSKCGPTQVYHSERESLMSSSSQSQNFIGTGKPVAWLSHLERWGQDAFSEGEQTVDVSGVMNRFKTDSPARQTLRNLFSMEAEIICPPKRDLNLRSKNTKSAHAQRLELQDVHHGYVESPREQVRLQEELSIKEKSLRDTQIRGMHEMAEMKRAQEFRVDEFLVQKLRKKS